MGASTRCQNSRVTTVHKTFITALFVITATVAHAQTAQEEIGRFVGFYGDEVERTGFAPDQSSTRESRIAFLQQTVKRFCSPLLAMKRADPGRPISDEVVVFVKLGPEYRVFSDFIPSGGSANWRLSDHLEGKLPIAQPLVNPLTLGLLQEASFAPTVPGCSPPMPEPTPAPVPVVVVPPYPGDPTGNLIGLALFADYAERGEAPNSGMAIWIWRCAWDMANQGLSADQAVEKHRAEWRRALGLPTLP